VQAKKSFPTIASKHRRGIGRWISISYHIPSISRNGAHVRFDKSAVASNEALKIDDMEKWLLL